MNIGEPAQAARRFFEASLSILKRMFGGRRRREPLLPLYRAIVAASRDPAWYRTGQVPDTMDGRFDMLAALTALVLIRLEREGEAGREPAVLLTELFIADMDESLRQIGIGDYVVGKHVGRMTGALGGRLAAFRAAGGGFMEPVRRNIFHEAPPTDESLAFVSERLERWFADLEGLDLAGILEGRLP